MKTFFTLLVLFLFSFTQAKAICMNDDDLMDYAIVSYMETTWATMEACMERVPNFDYKIYDNFFIKFKKVNKASNEFVDAYFKTLYGTDIIAKKKKKENIELIVNDYKKNVINKIDIVELCERLNYSSQKYIDNDLQVFLDDVAATYAREARTLMPRCESSDFSNKPVWEQVDTLVCEQQVVVDYDKNKKEENVETKGVNKSMLQIVYVFDFVKNKIHRLDASNRNGVKKYSTVFYESFENRGDIFMKKQKWDKPTLKSVNDYIFGNAGYGYHLFNFSIKNKRWVMLHSTSFFNTKTTDEQFGAKLSKYYCRSEDGFIEKLGLYDIF